MMILTSPTTLLCTQKDLDEATRLLAQYRSGTLGLSSTVSEQSLWRAKQIRDSMLHPQTHEVILAPFRMSAFMPMNIVICYGLLLPHTTILRTATWQWINQSYNLLVNYANRNTSNELSNTQIAAAYATAVTASVSIAVALGQAVRAGKIPRFLSPVAPYVAVASAGVANVIVMRYNEISEGVSVRDVNGDSLGVSREAGKLGVGLSAVSRAVWSIPALVVPPMVMSVLKKNAKFARATRWHVPMELLSIAVSLTYGVPFAIALFKPTMEVPVEKLEPEFRGRVDKYGVPIKTVFFHKGL